MHYYKAVTKCITKIAEIICMVAVAGLVLMIVCELIGRNFFNFSFRAMIEICGILFLWMAFMGIIPLYNNNALMRLDFLSSRMKGFTSKLFFVLNKLFSGMLGVVMIIAFNLQYPFISTRTYATIPQLPYTIQYLPMALAGGFIVLKTVEQLIEFVLQCKNKNDFV